MVHDAARQRSPSLTTGMSDGARGEPVISAGN